MELPPASQASPSPTVTGDSPTLIRGEAPDAAEIPAGLVPGYEILDVLGRGGTSVVYKARQTSLNRLVALKMMLAGRHSAAEQRVRFRAEAEAVARLQHPNIVQIFDVGEHEGQPYLSLEYVDGGSLAQRIHGQPWPVRPAARLVEVVARAIHTTHRHGIVHRDLKPGNVLLARNAECGTRKEDPGPGFHSEFRIPNSEFEPKVTDFGVAKLLDKDKGQTKSGDVIGTPSYMAPEQASGQTKDAGPATDVYSLGAILYELITGRPPFHGRTTLDTLQQVLNDEPVLPARLQPRVPRDLQTICLKCLRKEPAQRYASAEALADDLHAFLAGEPIKAQPPGLWQRAVVRARSKPFLALAAGAGGVALLGLVVGGWCYNALAVSGLAVLSLLAGGWWYSARLQAAVREIREQHLVAERQVERLHLLLENTRRLVSAGDLDTLLRLLGETTTGMANAERATVYLIDRARGELWSKVVLGAGVGEIRLPLGSGIAGTVAATGQTINIPDAYADPRFNPEIDQRTGYRTRNLLTFPMIDERGQILGVFQVLNKRGGPFGPEDVEMLSMLAASAAVAVQKALQLTEAVGKEGSVPAVKARAGPGAPGPADADASRIERPRPRQG